MRPESGNIMTTLLIAIGFAALVSTAWLTIQKNNLTAAGRTDIIMRSEDIARSVELVLTKPCEVNKHCNVCDNALRNSGGGKIVWNPVAAPDSVANVDQIEADTDGPGGAAPRVLIAAGQKLDNGAIQISKISLRQPSTDPKRAEPPRKQLDVVRGAANTPYYSVVSMLDIGLMAANEDQRFGGAIKRSIPLTVIINRTTFEVDYCFPNNLANSEGFQCNAGNSLPCPAGCSSYFYAIQGYDVEGRAQCGCQCLSL